MDGSSGWGILFGWMIALSVWAVLGIGVVVGMILFFIFGIRKQSKMMAIGGPLGTLGVGVLLAVASYYILNSWFGVDLFS